MTGPLAARLSSPEPGRKRTLWITWVVASGAGGLLSGLVMVWMWWIGALLLGAVFSLPQWLLLRALVPRASRWVAFTTVGVLVGWVAGALFAYPAGMSFLGASADMHVPVLFVVAVAMGVAIGGGAAGAVVGLAQRPVLRELLPSPDAWVPGSSLAGACLALAGVAPLAITGLDNSWVWAVSGLSGGLAHGIVTATVLVRPAAASPSRGGRFVGR